MALLACSVVLGLIVAARTQRRAVLYTAAHAEVAPFQRVSHGGLTGGRGEWLVNPARASDLTACGRADLEPRHQQRLHAAGL